MSEKSIQKTGETTVIAASDGRVTLSVPIRIKRRGGRKQVTLPIDPVTSCFLPNAGCDDEAFSPYQNLKVVAYSKSHIGHYRTRDQANGTWPKLIPPK